MRGLVDSIRWCCFIVAPRFFLGKRVSWPKSMVSRINSKKEAPPGISNNILGCWSDLLRYNSGQVKNVRVLSKKVLSNYASSVSIFDRNVRLVNVPSQMIVVPQSVFVVMISAG